MQSTLIPIARPFLKWAGGKGQLIEALSARLPTELKDGRIKKYVEPFVGGGAFFFHISANYSLEELYLSDFNEELILAYRTIREDVDSLIQKLARIETRYQGLGTEEQSEFFYKKRTAFNTKRHQIDFDHFSIEWVERTAEIIFLNHTCFNGLFRVNSKGEFNVPFGRYKSPKICDAENLRAVSQVLQQTVIERRDFTDCDKYVDEKTLVYFDPPYRPISKTSSFTSYSKYDFDDKQQDRLAEFFKHLDAKGAKLILSNSDPKNENPQDDFFETLYGGFRIYRVPANRMINCDATKRGQIMELVITNY